MSYGWTVAKKSGGDLVVLRTDATCGDHCKEIARKDKRLKLNKEGDYYIIYDPLDNPYMSSSHEKFKRFQWSRI